MSLSHSFVKSRSTEKLAAGYVLSGFDVKQFRASRTLGLQLSGAYCVVILSGNFCPQGKLGLQLSVMYIVSCFHCVEKPRETQRGPERPREPQRGSVRHGEAQRGPKRPGTWDLGPERMRVKSRFNKKNKSGFNPGMALGMHHWDGKN